jgi:SpoVK/Ycf46/Vps4 family AAA+-type ATPase
VEQKVQYGPQGLDKGLTQIDLVRGKGRGLIILLHGPPGSGKTSTAETLAAYTRRPLYPITCGDLGTSPERVEAALVEHTERAQRWGCILLLDEADVFLSRRDWRNTEHNALVSGKFPTIHPL